MSKAASPLQSNAKSSGRSSFRRSSSANSFPNGISVAWRNCRQDSRLEVASVLADASSGGIIPAQANATRTANRVEFDRRRRRVAPDPHRLPPCPAPGRSAVVEGRCPPTR